MEETAATSAPDPFPASRLPPEPARARTEELFRIHGRLVFGLCRGLLRSTHEAEDAAQQAFLSVHAAFLRGAEPDDPARWLATVARNECLTRIRERMRRPLPFADPDDTASAADPVAEAARRADIGALWRAVGALAPQQREALLLREFGGLSYDELAVALGISVPAVESLLFRARTRLRVELKAATAALSGLVPRLLAGGGAVKVAGVTVAAGVLTTGIVASERRLAYRPIPRPAAVPAPQAKLPDRRESAPAPRPAAPPAVRRTAVRAPHRQVSTPVAFGSSTAAPVPTVDSHQADEPSAPAGDGAPAAVPVESPPAATVPPDDTSGGQLPQPTDTGGGDGSGDTSPQPASTEQSGGSEAAPATSEDGADTPGS